MALGNGEIAVATERLTFVWIVRNEGQRSCHLVLRFGADAVRCTRCSEDTSWIADVLQDAIQLAPPGFLRVLVYVTGKKPVTVPSSLTSPTSTLVPVEVPSSKQDDETIELKPLSHRKGTFYSSFVHDPKQAIDDHLPAVKRLPRRGQLRLLMVDLRFLLS